MKKILSNLLIIICFCSFCYFGYNIYNYVTDEKEQQKINEGIIDEAVKKVEQNNNEEEHSDMDNPLVIDFNTLKEKNNDIIAWLYSEGTPINYPIVQTTNNDYYLRRLIDGTYNQAGTIFMDCKNSGDFSDFNTIIYGHNMKNDSMFGTLTNYDNQNYYDEHKEMFLYTENEKFKIEIFAGFITSSESDIYYFPKTSSTNENLIDYAIKNSTFKSNIKVSNEDKIITLSTCSYNFENARYVVLGILRKI